ncbi:MAG: DUF1489 family protein, partial [Beijerinckiaceae bacterium]
MPLHLIKLCVGAQTIGDLESFVAERILARRRRGEPEIASHVTRITPRRSAELLDGGSLYWVIKGRVAARQSLLSIEPFVDSDGVGRCRLVLEPRVIAVAPRSCRAFQGWRYLAERARPPDLDSRSDRRSE